MNREADIDSVPALDKRFEEVTAELVQLKRSRNLVLGAAWISPENLGCIFRLSTIPESADGDFAGFWGDLAPGLLLVCHH